MRTSVAAAGPWRKSSRSGGEEGGSNCVEVAGAAQRVALRDSKNPTQGTLVFTSAQWKSFLTHITQPPPLT